MVTVAAVQVTNYCGRGAEYVRKLFDGCRRYLPDARYVCLTDDPSTVPEYAEARLVPAGMKGWWNKMYLFSPDAFTPGERVLFFDLDTLITGDISEIAGYSGSFAIARDPFHEAYVSSAVMAWEAGTADHIWHIWDGAGRPETLREGDQKWIEFLVPGIVLLNDVFPRQIVSFKKHCFRQGLLPAGARICMLHGQPRPHDAALVIPWINRIWNQPTDQGDY